MPSCHKRTATPIEMLGLVRDGAEGREGELPKPDQKRIL